MELNLMKKLSKVVKRGYILAKAVRLAAIAKPKNLEWYDLAESINVDDVLSSFILKACLFETDNIAYEFRFCKCHVKVSNLIYKKLIENLENNLVESLYSGEKPVNCKKCVIERGCCKRRKLMLAMSKNILQWMTKYTNKLRRMKFYR